MNQLKNILFDMGGVLVDLDRQSCVTAYEKLSFKHIDTLLGEYGQLGAFKELEEGVISESQFYDAIRQEIPQASNQEIAHAFIQFLQGLPVERLQLLRRLKAQGYRLLMLSNTNPVVFPYICENYFTQEGFTIHDYFETLFLSYELGAIKPDPKSFEEVILRSGIDPRETLFIDDSQENLRVAAQFGFETYLALPGVDFSHIFNPS